MWTQDYLYVIAALLESRGKKPVQKILDKLFCTYVCQIYLLTFLLRFYATLLIYIELICFYAAKAY